MPMLDDQLAEMAANPPAQPQQGEAADAPDFQTINPDDVEEPNEQVMDAEMKLSELGYDVGEPDGLFDEQTQSAVRQFKQEMEMEDAEDPTLTADTMQAIMDAAPEGLSTEMGEMPAEQAVDIALG